MTDDEITLRRARPEDAANVTMLVHAAYAKWVSVIGNEPIPMRIDQAAAIDTHEIWLAEARDAVIGVLDLVADGDALMIENVAVTPNAQGLGLGRHLLALAESRAADLGFGRMRLYTNALMIDNIEFYKKLGYTITATDDGEVGTRLYMEKTIPI